MATPIPKKSIEETYLKNDPREQVLLRPDSFVGSVEPRTAEVWVCDLVPGDTLPDPTPLQAPDPAPKKKALPLTDRITLSKRAVTFAPAFLKLFDELVVNCCDLYARDPNDVSKIEMWVDAQTHTIRVRNTGKGVPVAMHEKHKVYVPELIFGHLYSGSNYDDAEERTTGGRNGEGAKLTNIFSTRFTLETVDVDAKKKYVQTWTANMSQVEPPKITASALKTGYTDITYTPDLPRFQLTELNEDLIALLRRRAVDVGGLVGAGVKVLFNDQPVSLPSFKRYCELYSPPFLVYEEPKAGCRWSVGVSQSPDGAFHQVSFVNSVATERGGTHVDACANLVVAAISESLKKKKIELPASQIKAQLWLFVACTLVNPSFDSQCKELCNLPVRAFGSRWEPSEGFLDKVCKSPIMDALKSKSKEKEEGALKKTDGTKTSTVTGIPKLVDATLAGTRKSAECTLFLCEGDSAASLCIAGLSVVGQDHYGVFPLRGKLLNVRDASVKSVLDNEEIAAMKKILGLQQGKTYETTSSLRYGRVAIFADQDHDGSHIAGLIMNFFDVSFPSLLALPGFLCRVITPVVKATKGQQTLEFFSLPQLEEWEKTKPSGIWAKKYYKGLATSTKTEAKGYFSDLPKYRKQVEPADATDRADLDLVFNKKRADDRKTWLAQVPAAPLDARRPSFRIHDFVASDLFQFSMADNVRSIPSVLDGLKPVQRKCLYTCFREKLVAPKEMKVTALAGLVTEKAAYHAGEASLQLAIMSMAQSFVGANAVPLLADMGQFGSRWMNGQDRGSPRYVSTALTPIAGLLFPEADQPILEYLEDDNTPIEPRVYLPIVPFLLLNSISGIGTGWSCDHVPYHPLEVLKAVRARLEGTLCSTVWTPWFRGFKGTVEVDGSGKKAVSKGVWSLRDVEGERVLTITELPIDTSIQDYKERLEAKVKEGLIRSAVYRASEGAHFTVVLHPDRIKDSEIEGTFKLTTNHPLANAVAFDPLGQLHRYASPNEVIDAYLPHRLEAYGKRRAYQLADMQKKVAFAQAKVRFIGLVLAGTLTFVGKTRSVLDKELGTLGFDTPEWKTALLDMSLSSCTVEHLEKLKAESDRLDKEKKALENNTATSLWLSELAELETALTQLLATDSAGGTGNSEEEGRATQKGKAPKASAPKGRKTAPPKA